MFSQGNQMLLSSILLSAMDTDMTEEAQNTADTFSDLTPLFILILVVAVLLLGTLVYFLFIRKPVKKIDSVSNKSKQVRVKGKTGSVAVTKKQRNKDRMQKDLEKRKKKNVKNKEKKKNTFRRKRNFDIVEDFNLEELSIKNLDKTLQNKSEDDIVFEKKSEDSINPDTSGKHVKSVAIKSIKMPIINDNEERIISVPENVLDVITSKKDLLAMKNSYLEKNGCTLAECELEEKEDDDDFIKELSKLIYATNDDEKSLNDDFFDDFLEEEEEEIKEEPEEIVEEPVIEKTEQEKEDEQMIYLFDDSNICIQFFAELTSSIKSKVKEIPINYVNAAVNEEINSGTNLNLEIIQDFIFDGDIKYLIILDNRIKDRFTVDNINEKMNGNASYDGIIVSLKAISTSTVPKFKYYQRFNSTNIRKGVLIIQIYLQCIN